MTIISSFAELGLPEFLLQALQELGYETPSPIQSQSIPVFLSNQDLIAQAQTGTGKTAAFGLPILMNLDLEKLTPQALILAPTRELAIQVAEALRSYAKNLKGFHIVSIYGGQEYRTQLRALERGVHVVVGTPGRVMDHLRRGTLKLNNLKTLVLDEADEMLRMGFLESVEWILEQIPGEHQTALFSATMPPKVRSIANKYLKNPQHIQIQTSMKAVDTIEQCFTIVSGHYKLDALTRFLETESYDAAIVFARTKTATLEIAQKLQARGYAADALNGDVKQSLRERIIKRLKDGDLDLIVATDVAARGLDVDRISLVVNYDMPYDAEAYIHRIGRTGRAGRQGKAVLFVTPRERRSFEFLERDIKQPMKAINPPSASQIEAKQQETFHERILEVIATQNLDRYREAIETLSLQSEHSDLDIAAALAYLVQGKKKKATYDDKESFISDEDRPRGRGDDNRSRGRSSDFKKERAPRRFSSNGPRRSGEESKSRSGEGSKRFSDRPARTGERSSRAGDDTKRPSGNQLSFKRAKPEDSAAGKTKRRPADKSRSFERADTTGPRKERKFKPGKKY